MRSASPRVLLLDGDYDNTLVIADELVEDLDATVVGVGTTRHSRLLRSTYCDDGRILPPPDSPSYADALLELIERDRPDIVLPVGYDSMAAVQTIRASIPGSVALCVPSTDAFRVAADKAATLRRGREIGLETPADYSDVVADLEADGRPEPDGTLPFPIFLKARWENGGVTTAPVTEPAAFWETYDRIAAGAPNDDVLVQEYVDGTDSTYGCGLCCFDTDVELAITHEELRSVPRHGGSGTHLRISPGTELESHARRLLRELGWHGVALVEFKRRPDGTAVLMEINPKFWASYALASRFGYRFASTIVATQLELDVDLPVGSPAPSGEMVFPLRELQFAATNWADERILESLSTLAAPGAVWDVDRRDLGAWLTPPPSLLERFLDDRSPHSVDRGRSNAAVELAADESDRKATRRAAETERLPPVDDSAPTE
ncbi:ATP-dependent carboxylate-amine ligase [Natrialbaceae archaeon AArc-T1-2]|uniref:ATP-dependent carboxylate-amine ligase n=1 Tax=Natrialbaceae archaeon AArc-T1-2 TaxID=3053904 RepID=UPI00255AC131|nr:ATP-dependent carboxylate-amine ligase [Natrialbaceae archaeon AArc-T1-2]WIV68612.1 ATP-dependent carboxylate-amine ligase [Natrialbaceae archaeon AArc-T1-2]